MTARGNPLLTSKARRHSDPVTGDSVLLFPEGVLRLNRTGADIVALCDGSRSHSEIVLELAERNGTSPERIQASVTAFLRELKRRRLLCDEEQLPVQELTCPANSQRDDERMRPLGARPLGLLAELTYRCPMRSPYCSNPETISATELELTTDEWQRVFSEAADIGVLHVHLSGGEPLLHRDIVRLVAAARNAGLYTNLLTSGVSLTRPLADQLRTAGLDHVQLSFQADQSELADRLAGVSVHSAKLSAARLVREMGWPLTMNVVLHQYNIERVPQMIALAEELGAERLELANVQFYGWGHLNRANLRPSRTALLNAGRQALEATRKLCGIMEIVYVSSDSLAERPKACMGGWGNRQLTVNPFGDVLPCPNAGCISSLRFDNIRQQSLKSIWENSDAFNRFRGTDWMPDPCRNCDQREIDFGGCRCQAQLLTGSAFNTDPACDLSPHHGLIAMTEDLTGQAVPTEKSATIRLPLIFRENPSFTFQPNEKSHERSHTT